MYCKVFVVTIFAVSGAFNILFIFSLDIKTHNAILGRCVSGVAMYI